jgi:hypothetical protein
MKANIYLFFTIAFCCLCSGCASTGSLEKSWYVSMAKAVPIGTTKEDAVKIMRNHGFYSSAGALGVYGQKDTAFHIINISFELTNNKISSPPDVNIGSDIHM